MTRYRVFIRIPSDDAFELKAQALNNDPRLKAAGIAALKFVGDKKYLADGNFSPELPPQDADEPPIEDSKNGERLRVFVRIPSEDSYELKAQALNKNPILKNAGILGLRNVGDKQYIVDGEFTETLPASPEPELEKSKSPPEDAVRVTIRMPNELAYQLIADILNDDPRLQGISSPSLVKPSPPALVSVKPRRKNRVLTFAIVMVMIAAIAAGVVFAAPIFLAPAVVPAATTAIVVKKDTSTSTKAPVLVAPSSTSPAVIITKTQPPPTATRTETPTLEPALSLSCQPVLGVITAELLSCRYGPGASYLYRSAFSKGNEVQVIGRADTGYGTWVYVQSPQNEVKCWINSSSKFVELDQDLACVESYYPEKAPLIIFNTSLFPAPTNVQANRSGGYVSISWVGYDLALGDRESETSPRYLVEAWTCQGGQIVFSPIGTSDEFVDVPDETGCSEPSHGQVFLAHRDGYIGPSFIPWP